jgi:hypothetical protein
MSNINERETDTTTVQPSTQTVRFERMSNGKCDLTFTPTPTTPTTTTTSTTNNTSKAATDTTTTQPNSVSIPNVSFPYEFDPLDHGFDNIYGEYKFDCCGCPYLITIEAPVTTTSTTEEVTTTTTTKDVTTTTTKKDVTTTTTTEDVTTTTTTEDVCDNCTTVRVRRINSSNTISFDYIDCDNDSQTHAFTTKVGVVDLCVCAGSIPSSDDYTVEFIEECTTGLPVLTCDLLAYSVNNGTNGELVSYSNGSDLFITPQITPFQYVLGQRTYTVSVTVPAGYSNAGETLECVSDEVIVSQGGGDTTTTSTKGPNQSYCAKVTYGSNSPNKLQTSLGGEIHEFLITMQNTVLDSEGGGYFNKCTDTGEFFVVEGNNSPRIIRESDEIDVTFNTDDLCDGDYHCDR